MPTFLTTSKMDPALAARIEASVTGQKAVLRSAAHTRRIASFARLLLVVTLAFGIYSIVVFRRESRRTLEQARASLLESVRANGDSLSTEGRAAMSRAEAWLLRLAGTYEGDLVDDDVRSPDKLAAMLARPLVYVRGTPDGLGRSEAIPAAAAASTKDALVVCLLDPPTARTEPALLDKVRIASAAGWKLESHTPNVRTLDELAVGISFFSPAWSERVRTSEDAREISRLRMAFDHAPLDQAKRAASSDLLLVAIDEPADASSTELGGEQRHPVRVVLVDLAASKVLLRSRHIVDPSWLTPARRATAAAGFDSCALALDVLDDVRKAQ